MKPTFTLIIILLAVNVFAQTERRNWHLGGGVNVSFDTREYEFAPTGIHLQQGYFLKKNLLIGLQLSSNFFAISTIPSNDPYQVITSKKRYIDAVATPFVRYFVGKSQWRPYFEGPIGVAYKSVKQLYNDPTQNQTLANGYYPITSIGCGFAYFPRKNWGMDFGLNFQIIDKSPDGTYWNSPISLKVGLRNILCRK